MGFPYGSAGRAEDCKGDKLLSSLGRWFDSSSKEVINFGFPDSSGKESTCNAGDPGLIPGLGRSPGEGIGYPLQYSGLENFMDCVVHGVTKSQTRLSDFQFIMWIASIKIA